MKLSTFILIASLVQVSAAGFAQKITLKQNTASLKQIFSEIKKQTGYDVFYQAGKVNEDRTIKVNFSNTPLEEVMKRCLEGQALSFVIDERTVLIKEKAPSFLDRVIERFAAIDVRGMVVDENGQPLSGATVKAIRGSSKSTTTNANGEFILIGLNEDVILQISYIGYKTREINPIAADMGTIKMEPDDMKLDEVRVSTGYWTSEKAKNVGNIVKVTAKDIENQPVTSPLLALQGRVAGVEIAPVNGTPGGAVNIRIRGLNSLRKRSASDSFNDVDGNLPLYVIDGIPVNSIPVFSASQSLTKQGYDPLATLNPADIEHIQILKDADATAIYGSRGANGVVLVTTKNRKAAVGINIDVNSYHGFGNLPKRADVLSGKEYLMMRKEAIKNDGPAAEDLYNDPDYADFYFPDLLHRDTTKFTDWQKTLMGDPSRITDGHIRISGGNGTTSFSIGGAYHKETMLYFGDFGYNRYSGDLSINHQSADNKFGFTFASTYGVANHNIFDSHSFLSTILKLPPIAPNLYNADGTLNWDPLYDTSTFGNPLALLRVKQTALSNNLYSNFQVRYQLLKGLNIKANIGYSSGNNDETINTPISSQDPYSFGLTIEGNSKIISGSRSGWNFEPQLEYSAAFGDHHINSLAGLTFQQNENESMLFNGTGYVSDALLGTLAGARKIENTTSNSQYRYNSVYARIGYDFRERYLLNLTARRDGSSRFGPNHRYGNFGAIGIGWLFTNEKWLSDIPVISFGKVRVSYGVTGNDMIGDTRYLKTYSVMPDTYNGAITIIPTALFNADYRWEVTRKFEGGVELGLFKDRISVEVAFFRNRSSNQLVDYTLPATSGFSGVLTNFPATIENKGWEYVLNTRNVVSSNFNWTTSFNISFLNNKLVAFDGIESSAYASQYQVGRPLDVQNSYVWKGVDPATGLHTFEDLNNDGRISGSDQKFTGSLATKYFGGLSNTFSYKGVSLSFLFNFSDRVAEVNYFTSTPGDQGNQPRSTLDRWQKAGDITNVQRFATEYGTEARSAFIRFANSDGVFQRIRFIRLRTLSLQYALPTTFISKSAKVFLQGQNLLTFSNNSDLWDPETLGSVPPLKILNAGVQLTF